MTTTCAPADTSVSTRPSVLFVDLDDTLVRTDLLAETVVKAAKQFPLELMSTVPTLLHGRAAFKSAVARIATPDVTQLPYRTDVLEELQRQSRAGISLVLATASPQPWAQAVADHLGIFDAVLASDEHRNLKGRHKLVAIRDYATREHHSAWAYMGDSTSDLPIFAEADQGYLVTSSRDLETRARQAASGRLSVLRQSRSSWRDVAKALRPHQWAKNVLVFVPMILAHAFTWGHVFSALLAWICFSCVASGVYVLNDLLDVESDRRHPRKCRRPFASARLPLSAGPPLVVSLLIVGATLAVATLPTKFVLLLGVYWGLTTLYSAWLKNKLILDVMVLAGLYTLRVIAGGAAVNVPVSEWLMAFSMFLFTSLAFAKRYAELSRLADDCALQLSTERERGVAATGASEAVPGGTPAVSAKPHGRSYRVEDIGLIESLGPTSGYLSVLVLALYINGPQVSTLYRNGWVLWYVCPVLLYWITRLWFVAKRRKLSEDPVVFALRDGVSQFTGLVVGVLMYIAIAL